MILHKVFHMKLYIIYLINWIIIRWSKLHYLQLYRNNRILVKKDYLYKKLLKEKIPIEKPHIKKKSKIQYCKRFNKNKIILKINQIKLEINYILSIL